MDHLECSLCGKESLLAFDIWVLQSICKGWNKVAVSEVFGWSRIPNNTRRRSRIFLSDSDSGSPFRSFFTSHSLVGNSCWNGTIYYKTFVETEISCCVPRFPLILTAKILSLYVKEPEILARSGSGTITEQMQSIMITCHMLYYDYE